MTFPIGKPPIHAVSTKDRSIPMKKKKILVVDDNRGMLRFMTNLMTREGHSVETAEDGFTALDKLDAFRPDILFVDLIMPKIAGDKLCRYVRKSDHLKDCYVVVVSAAAAEMDLDYRAIGADACIAKGPFAAMAQNVMEVIQESESERDGERSKAILGLENIYARRITQELLSRNRHLETILESIAEGILEIDSGRIAYANPAAARLFKTDPEKLLAGDPLDLFDPEMRPRVRKRLETAEYDPASAEAEAPIELHRRLVTVKSLPIQGEPAASILIVTDVTERVQLEQQLRHMQKMEAVGTIASGVAHNFRNTLAGILVNSQILEMDFKDVPGVADIVSRINRSVKRGASLVEGLAQFTRKQDLKEFAEFNLAEVMQEVIHLIRESFDRKIVIEVDVPDHLPCRGDAANLVQALMNLCTNARDAMPQGGTLTLRATTDQGQTRITVADTGCGMDAAAQEKCFDPFFTTKPVGVGTGLGLSTTYGIVKAHKGTIRVASKIGEGSQFTIALPVGPPRQPAEVESATELLRGSGEKVLVVDDDPAIHSGLTMLLQKIGYITLSASDGAEAVRHHQAFDPDIVLLDKNMPGMDGNDCLEELLNKDPEANVVVISGYDPDGPDGLDESGKRKVRGFLKKPVDIRELSAMLQKILQQSQQPQANG